MSHSIKCSSSFATACSKMIYWMGDKFLLGLDPFMINNKYNCCFMEFAEVYVLDSKLDYLGECGGCLKIMSYHRKTDYTMLWDVNEEEIFRTAGTWKVVFGKPEMV